MGSVKPGLLTVMLCTAIAGCGCIIQSVAVAESGINLAQASSQGQLTLDSESMPSVLPDGVKIAVLQVASAQVGLKPEQFTLVKATPKIWSDGCLGLADPGQICAAVLVKGWQVRLAHERQEWVYRTNTSGSAIKYDQAAGRLSQLVKSVAEKIPEDQLPSKMERSVLFRQIKSGGFAGVSQETRLYKDGRLSQTNGSGQGKSGETILRRLPKQEVRAFRQLLEQRAFGQFDRLSYPAPSGAADYFVITLSTRQSTTQYADINQNELPSDLKAVIVGWQNILKGR